VKAFYVVRGTCSTPWSGECWVVSGGFQTQISGR